MSTTDSTPETEQKNKSKNFTLLAFIVVFFFLVVVLPRFFNSPNTDKNKEPESGAPKSSQNIGSYTTIIEVHYTGQYKETIHLPNGFKFGFVNSSQPYSVKNKNDEEIFGEKGEDIAGNFSIQGDCNTELRFASRNGKSGNVIILLKSN